MKWKHRDGLCWPEGQIIFEVVSTEFLTGFFNLVIPTKINFPSILLFYQFLLANIDPEHTFKGPYKASRFPNLKITRLPVPG